MDALSFHIPQFAGTFVALDLLDVLDRSGCRIPDGLVDAVSKADDQAAEELLKMADTLGQLAARRVNEPDKRIVWLERWHSGESPSKNRRTNKQS